MVASLAATLGIPAALALLGIWRRWLSASGAVSGFAVGVVVASAGWRPTLMLALFFVAGSLLTKASKRGRAALHVHADPNLERLSSADHAARGGWQVASTAGVPALLCAASLLAPPSASAALLSAYAGFMACDLGDTAASELGVLAGRDPILVTTLRAVPPGTDGAVSFEGFLASAVGASVIGACMLPDWRLAMVVAVAGFWGAAADSLFGAVSQAPYLRALTPAEWKRRNNAVNAASGCVAAVLAAVLAGPWGRPAVPLLALGAAMLTLAVAPATPFVRRKGLHLCAGALVLANADQPWLLGVVAGAVLVLAAVEPRPLAVFEVDGCKRGGVLLAVLLGVPLRLVLAPMCIADPAAALAGAALGTRRLWGSKTLAGSASFFVVALALLLAWRADLPPCAPGAVLAAALCDDAGALSAAGAVTAAMVGTMTELATAGWDNIALVVVMSGMCLLASV